MTVTVVGLGKIGLPLAVQFARKGETVLGADINKETVDLVNKGIEPFPEEENLQEYLSEVVNEGKLKASTSTTSCVQNSDVVVVVVPLFVNSNAEPDFRAMDSATEDIARGLQIGTLVAYETTLPVGTTRNRFTGILEGISGLVAGEDFFVVFSPERVLTGRVFSDLRKYPKIVGGITDKCSEIGKNFYSRVLDFDPRNDLNRENGVWVLDSCESAEFVKLAETTYRDVNIGLANQFAKFADKLQLNIYNIIDASNSQPYSHIHQPGIAVGGHCIPIYPQFYLWGDKGATVVREARIQNEAMPKYAVDKIESNLGSLKGKYVLVLGASYRDGVKELAFSGAFELKKQLADKEANIDFFDPLFSKKELNAHGLNEISDDLGKYEILIIQNSSLLNTELLKSNSSLNNVKFIYDGRNLLKGVNPIANSELITLGLGLNTKNNPNYGKSK
jgi:nucleotide sugar dehydrogenase